MMYAENTKKFSGHILLAEPNLDNQALIGELLAQHGVQVTMVNNGSEAIEQCQRAIYDLILLDINMSSFNGLETTRLLLQGGCMTPIVALADNATAEDKQQCRLAGCSAFLSTPVNHAHFTAVLACFLQPAVEEVNPIYSTLLQQESDVGDLVANFLEKLPGMVAQIHAAVQSQDMTELSHLLHNMKSIGGGYGFPQLTELSEAMEYAVIDEAYAKMHDYLHRFDSLCESIIMGGISDGLVERYAYC